MRPRNEATDQKHRSFIEAARRDQIVAAAIETLADVGYAKTSFARIAEQAGISAGLISYHFDHKAELFEQVVADINALMDAWLTEHIGDAASYREALRRLIGGFVRFCDTHRRHVLALGQVLAGLGGQENRELVRSQREIAVGQIEQLLREGQEHGEFRDFSPRFMAVALLGSLEAIPSELFARPETDVDAYAKELSVTYDLAVRRSRLSRIGRG
ncbi:TetR/AcrR family transcriptional regulator [Jiangella rhizosphaerae]|uniref:TetR family transcriptional regulator n=1 Tax=Jiangella rhizosphaerae TaxID=2293569 RepID=A0A418KM74_9ACTN|nr:TetR/AcrR family transcriptional regulator [Jiangella rhizosphaerae]RIQ19517.1 TetR family transcriptional regulator [Jiangella rhizosphaerae]